MFLIQVKVIIGIGNVYYYFRKNTSPPPPLISHVPLEAPRGVAASMYKVIRLFCLSIKIFQCTEQID